MASSNDDEVVSEFQSLTPDEEAVVYKIYNLLVGGITDPQLQALLIFRHLQHTGWLPPKEAKYLAESRENAKEDIKLLRKEIDSEDTT